MYIMIYPLVYVYNDIPSCICTYIHIPLQVSDQQYYVSFNLLLVKSLHGRNDSTVIAPGIITTPRERGGREGEGEREREGEGERGREREKEEREREIERVRKNSGCESANNHNSILQHE